MFETTYHGMSHVLQPASPELSTDAVELAFTSLRRAFPHISSATLTKHQQAPVFLGRQMEVRFATDSDLVEVNWIDCMPSRLSTM